jgi:hypothetical protein
MEFQKPAQAMVVTQWGSTTISSFVDTIPPQPEQALPTALTPLTMWRWRRRPGQWTAENTLKNALAVVGDEPVAVRLGEHGHRVVPALERADVQHGRDEAVLAREAGDHVRREVQNVRNVHPRLDLAAELVLELEALEVQHQRIGLAGDLRRAPALLLRLAAMANVSGQVLEPGERAEAGAKRRAVEARGR